MSAQASRVDGSKGDGDTTSSRCRDRQTTDLLSRMSDSEKVAFFDEFWRIQTEKRALVTDGNVDGGEVQAKAEQVPKDPQFHPLSQKDAPKVVLISSDGKAFSVDKQALLNHSTFFKDMFTLPNTGTVTNEPINLEEASDVLERILYGIYASEYDADALLSPSLKQRHAAVKAHDRFDIELNRSDATEELESALRKDPWAGLAYASHINDLELGRTAIQIMPLDRYDDSDIWALMSNVKHTWQIALGRLILPKMKVDNYKEDLDDHLSGIEWFEVSSTKFKISPKQVAKSFNPKDD